MNFLHCSHICPLKQGSKGHAKTLQGNAIKHQVQGTISLRTSRCPAAALKCKPLLPAQTEAPMTWTPSFHIYSLPFQLTRPSTVDMSTRGEEPQTASKSDFGRKLQGANGTRYPMPLTQPD